MDSKQKNRSLMPQTAKLIDWLREEIPEVKLLYAQEGQYVIGNRKGNYVEFQAYGRVSDDGANSKKSVRSKRKTV